VVKLNFAAGSGMDCLTTNVDALLTRIRKKYKEYGINEKPFVVVKADNGSHGMGIMTVRDVKDLDALKPTQNPTWQDQQSGHSRMAPVGQ
jgi:glutamate--cysteine ligase